MARNYRSSRVVTKSARRKDWGGAVVTVQLASGVSAFSYALGPSDLREFFVDPTVIRHQLILTASVPGAVTSGVVGAGVVAWDGDPDSNAAPADGPEVIDDLNADWLIRCIYPVVSNAGIQVYTASLDWNTESSAMRRLGNTRGLLLCFENFGVGAAVTLTAQYRYLLME